MRRPALAVVLVLALAACGRCTPDLAAAPERHVPAARLAVVVPELSEALRETRQVLATAAVFPALAWLPGWTTSVRGQLGFDPLADEGLESAGIDPGGGAAYAETGDGALLVLPIKDGAAFDAAVSRLARDRMGAAHRLESQRGPARVVALTPGPGRPAELAYATIGRVAILARGPASPEAVAAAAALDPKDTLESTPAWTAARAALGRGHAVVAFRGPADASRAAGTAGTGIAALWRDGAALGLSGEADRLSGRAVLLLGEDREQAWREIAGSPPRAAGEDLAHLPEDALVAARFGGSPAPVARRVLWAFPELARALAQAGVDAERDLFPAFSPGAALAISLAPTFDVTAVSRRARGSAVEDPFRLIHVSAFARTTSPERARVAVEALGAAARSAGFDVSADGEPAQSWSFSTGGAQVDVALAEDRLLVAGGPGRLEELRRLVDSGGGWSGPTSASRGLASGGAGALALDFGNLVRSSRSLPSSAYGTGPDAFVMRSIAERVLDPASRLEVATMRVDLGEGAVRADFVVEAREGAEPRR
jgi:hypothetical protein